MDEATISRYITETFEDVQTATANGDTFFFCGSERMFPFATLVTSDFNDEFSNLNRPSVFRLNIGVGKQTFQRLFSTFTPDEGGADRRHDYTALDRLMPHPVYGKMYWVCMLNPGEQTFQSTVVPLLREAYERDRQKYARRAASAERPGDA